MTLTTASPGGKPSTAAPAPTPAAHVTDGRHGANKRGQNSSVRRNDVTGRTWDEQTVKFAISTKRRRQADKRSEVVLVVVVVVGCT